MSIKKKEEYEQANEEMQAKYKKSQDKNAYLTRTIATLEKDIDKLHTTNLLMWSCRRTQNCIISTISVMN
jgi:cell division protein FtsB